MIAEILLTVGGWVASVIEAWGYGGIVFLMGIESACIPLPSELIMPFAGYLVLQGKMTLFWASIAGGVGCLWGSIVCYAIGYYGGRPFVEKYGKYLLIHKKDI